MIGENQIDYRFFIGFKLISSDEEVSLKNMLKSMKAAFSDFIREVNHKVMGDFVSINGDDISRYGKMERLLESKLSRRFKVRRLDKNDFGYLIEHFYGRDGVAYEDYTYTLPKRKQGKDVWVRKYDLESLREHGDGRPDKFMLVKIYPRTKIFDGVL